MRAARFARSISQCADAHRAGNMADHGREDEESHSEDDEQKSETGSCTDCGSTICDSCWQDHYGWLADWKADYENTDSDETTDADSDEEARATETHYHYYAPVHAETHHHYYPAFAPYTPAFAPAFAPAYGPALAPLDQLPASPPHQPVGNYDYPDYLRYRSNSSDSSSDEDQEEKPKTSAQQKEPAKKSDRARGRTQ